MGEKALIVAGGEVNIPALLLELKKGYDLLVAADSGGEVLAENGYTPDLLIGDFDSIDPIFPEKLRAKGTQIVEFPAEKDWTDLELAFEVVIKERVKEIIVFGAIGDRLDHTLGNLGLLYRATEKGVNACLIGIHERVKLIGPGDSQLLLPEEKTFFSLIPLFPRAAGVNVAKAKYPLHNATLPFGSTRGIHNEFLGEPVRVSIEEGYAFLLMQEEKA